MSSPAVTIRPLVQSLMRAALAPALDAYSTDLAQHSPVDFAGRPACACGYLPDRPTSRGCSIMVTKHIAAADAAAEDVYNAAVAAIAASLPARVAAAR